MIQPMGHLISFCRKVGRILLVAVAITVALALCVPAQAQVNTYTGTFADGATYLIEAPVNWNGTLLLYSHGYVSPAGANPARDVGDAYTGAFLLANGFALAGSSYASTGWAVQSAFQDQVATLEKFAELVGTPNRTIAWGHSLGGMITAGLVQKFPTLFTAALPMCGVTGGSVGTWNTALDGGFAFATLAGAGSGLELVNITNPLANLLTAEILMAMAQATPQGRARIALSAALADIPGWYSPSSPEPAATDYATQELNQFLWFKNVDLPFQFAFRGDLEARAGGNPSWNTGVDYAEQLQKSVDYDEVQALYAAAGLSLDADLQTLAAAPRISANTSAVAYLAENIVYNGVITVPVLTLHTTGDGLVVVEDEQAYKKIIDLVHDNSLLRQVFVHRAGHCAFTPAEQIVALQALLQRVNTLKWKGLDPGDLNNAALVLGVLNSAPPAFIDYDPAPFLRPFFSGDQP